MHLASTETNGKGRHRLLTVLRYECERARGNTRKCLIVILYEHRVLKSIELVLPMGTQENSLNPAATPH